jgi:hypothetical protein
MQCHVDIVLKCCALPTNKHREFLNLFPMCVCPECSSRSYKNLSATLTLLTNQRNALPRGVGLAEEVEVSATLLLSLPGPVLRVDPQAERKTYELPVGLQT